MLYGVIWVHKLQLLDYVLLATLVPTLSTDKFTVKKYKTSVNINKLYLLWFLLGALSFMPVTCAFYHFHVTNKNKKSI